MALFSYSTDETHFTRMGDEFIMVFRLRTFHGVRYSLLKEEQGEASQFQWQNMLRGDLMLMPVSKHRYLFADLGAGSLCWAMRRAHGRIGQPGLLFLGRCTVSFLVFCGYPNLCI